MHLGSKPVPGKWFMRPSLKSPTQKGLLKWFKWPSKHEPLSPNTSTTKKKKKKQGQPGLHQDLETLSQKTRRKKRKKKAGYITFMCI
jgi:hypothetical protein